MIISVNKRKQEQGEKTMLLIFICYKLNRIECLCNLKIFSTTKKNQTTERDGEKKKSVEIQIYDV